MFYRILTAPPGYPPHQRYIVPEYATLEFVSLGSYVKNMDGSIFFASLEEARMAIPVDARQLPFQQKYQFLELWESPEPGG
jgi:hypothetical protein